MKFEFCHTLFSSYVSLGGASQKGVDKIWILSYPFCSSYVSLGRASQKGLDTIRISSTPFGKPYLRKDRKNKKGMTKFEFHLVPFWATASEGNRTPSESIQELPLLDWLGPSGPFFINTLRLFHATASEGNRKHSESIPPESPRRGK